MTDLLREWTLGNLAAGDQLVPLIYDDLHRRAAAYLRRTEVRPPFVLP